VWFYLGLFTRPAETPAVGDAPAPGSTTLQPA